MPTELTLDPSICLQSFGQLVPCPLEWLWPGRSAFGKLAIFADPLATMVMSCCTFYSFRHFTCACDAPLAGFTMIGYKNRQSVPRQLGRACHVQEKQEATTKDKKAACSCQVRHRYPGPGENGHDCSRLSRHSSWRL